MQAFVLADRLANDFETLIREGLTAAFRRGDACYVLRSGCCAP